MFHISRTARWLAGGAALVLLTAWAIRAYRLPLPARAHTLNAGKTWDFKTRIDPTGVEQVWVPLGCFEMGSSLSDDIRAAATETPRHTVCITRGFWIDRYEVTNESFDQFNRAGGYRVRRYWSAEGWLNHQNRPNPYISLKGFDEPRQPRTKISWYEAEAYAAWRGGRLPTEAEWEWAARGPDSRRFPWGDLYRDGLANMDRLDLRRPQTVGLYPAGRSWCGADDMAGNVAEWVADGYDPEAYRRAPLLDPYTPPANHIRILKGGSWGGITGGSPADLRCARRALFGAEHRKGSHGARIVSPAQ